MNEAVGIRRFECAICHTQWPEHLMVLCGTSHQQYICCPCDGKLKKEEREKLNRRRTDGVVIGESLRPKLVLGGWLIGGLLLVVVLSEAFYVMVESKKKPRVTTAGKKVAPPEPTLNQTGPVLINSSLTLKSGSAMNMTTFFLKGPTGTVMVAPAVAFNAAHPSLPNARFESLIQKWTVALTGKQARKAAAMGLHENVSVHDDIWVADLAPGESDSLPASVLEPQPDPATAGAPVWLLRMANPPGSSGAAPPREEAIDSTIKSVFAGGAQFDVTLSERVPAKSLIGAPLVNANDQLVGIVISLGEVADENGKVGSVKAESSLELLGLRLPPVKKTAAPGR